MSETTTIDNEPNPQADQAQPEQQVMPPLQQQPEPPQPRLADRAEMIVVGPTGASPSTMAQQIDFGQYMAKAKAAIPAHLRGNVGDCLAVIDIASRAGLSPYMVAGKTYVQNDRLCFESQLFHALLVQSGKLIGDLEVAYAGDGDDMTCTVTGILKSDRKPRSLTSQPLGKARPPMTSKTVDGVKIEYVKGSPLWVKKPKVQLFYDTSRDWTRMYAPTATLGIYTPEEMLENPLGEEGAITVNQTAPDLHKRLQGVSREEGHRPGFAESELNNVAADRETEIKPATAAAKAAAVAQNAKPGSRAARRAKRTSTPSKAASKAPEKPEKSATQRKAEAHQADVPTGQPKTMVEYAAHAEKWIAKCKIGDIEARWDDEAGLRKELGVLPKYLKPLEAQIAARIADET